MTALFVVIVIIGIIAIIAFFRIIRDKNEEMRGCFFVLCVLFLIFSPIILLFIEEKGLYYDIGKIQSKVLLQPVHAPDDCIYLEFQSDSYGGKTYYFKTTEDTSILSRKWWQCQVCYHKENIKPYCELVTIEPKSWVRYILKPQNKRLQPRYILHVQSCNEQEILCKEYSVDVPY